MVEPGGVIDGISVAKSGYSVSCDVVNAITSSGARRRVKHRRQPLSKRRLRAYIQATVSTQSVDSQTPSGQFSLPTGVSIEQLTQHFCRQPSASVEALIVDLVPADRATTCRAGYSVLEHGERHQPCAMVFAAATRRQ